MVIPIVKALIQGSGHESEADALTAYRPTLELIDRYYTGLTAKERLELANTYQLNLPE